MTRRNKCDACRRAKIKCDEVLPQCSNCVRRGRACTHDLGAKNQFKFVEVRVEATDANQENQLGRREVVVSTARQRKAQPALRQQAARSPKLELSQADLFWTRCEESMLLTRWAFFMKNFINHVDPLGSWSSYVPHYLGKSEAVSKAARCFMGCRQVMAYPTEINLRMLRSSNIDAVRCIRQALEVEGSRPCKGDILLAIQLLYIGEALLMHSPVAFLIHVKGLMSLLKEHRNQLDSSDSEQMLLNRAIFQSTFANGFAPAIRAGTDHKLDDPEWLTMPLLARNISGIPDPMAQRAWTELSHSYILIPRLARLIRLLAASICDTSVEQEAIDLAQQLYTSNLNIELFTGAVGSGELRLEPTVLLETIEAVPMSYCFGSVRLSLVLASCWVCRLFICGLVDRLLAVAPSASLLFNASGVQEEDIRLATNALMAVQQTFTVVAAAADKSAYRGEEMRLLLLLEAAFGSWYRLEKRLKASGELLRNEELEQATRMKRLCLKLANQLLASSQPFPMTETGLEAAINLFSGGPLQLQMAAFGSEEHV